MGKVVAAVVANVILNGAVRAPGFVCELDEEDFDRLAADGFVEPAEESPVGVSISSRQSSIVDAILQLDTAGFTGGGLPRVESIEHVTGFEVSAAERDAAWAALSDEDRAALLAVEPEEPGERG